MRKKKKMKHKNEATGGIGFCGLLTIVFIVLKLTGYIGWNWLWVISPLWIPLAIVFGIFGIVMIVILILAILEKK